MNNNMGPILSFVGSPEVKETTHDVVARHPGHEVHKYTDLADAVAQLNFYNPHLNLFFRGQTIDHKRGYGRGAGKWSELRPKAFRDPISRDRGCSRDYLKTTLPSMARELMRQWKKHLPSWGTPIHRSARKRMDHFEESKWAVLQHYCCPTPLLDVTQSLQVACAFATTDKTEEPKDGYVYVLGLPNIHGYISFFTYESIVMVNLKAACPPEAKRAHHQEGYLVGSIPHTPVSYRYPHRDFVQRLVAKFHIVGAKEF